MDVDCVEETALLDGRKLWNRFLDDSRIHRELLSASEIDGQVLRFLREAWDLAHEI